MTFVKVSKYCSCGSSLEAEIRSTEIPFVESAWLQVHPAGPEHRDLDPATKKVDDEVEALRALVKAATDSEVPL